MSDENGHEEGTKGATATLALAHDYVLELDRRVDDHVLRILCPDGRAGLSITITQAGISVNVSGGDLTLRAEGALAIEAEYLSLQGRRGLALQTGGDATLSAEGDLHSEARIQNIRARLGNVNLQANDDVKLLGERIRLNT